MSLIDPELIGSRRLMAPRFASCSMPSWFVVRRTESSEVSGTMKTRRERWIWRQDGHRL